MDTRIVLEIDDELRRHLEARAETNHRSVEAEAVDLLWSGIRPLPDDPSLPLGQRIVRQFAGSGIWVDEDFQDRIDKEFRDIPHSLRNPFDDQGDKT